MSKFKTWEEVKEEPEKGFNEQDFVEIALKKQIIEATIAARKKANMTQKELSEKSGIVQSAIAKIERYDRVPQYTTLIKLLRPLGYTLKVVPINQAKEK